MPYITNTKSSGEVAIFYEDHGAGKPVILIHGWPLSHRSWDGQVTALVAAGYRVIAYDRRGFGRSGTEWNRYDYDTLASDLHALITGLNLSDVVLVGFSMGGGEVVRYLTNYGTERISKVALIASIIPLVPQKEDNPDGVPQEELDKITDALETDRLAFLKDFHKNFYNYSMLKKDVSEARLDADFIVASGASENATQKAAEAWATTDFRPELKNVTVPTLIVHGDSDNIVPIKTSAEQAAKGIINNEYHIIEGAPHGLNATHAFELNSLLLNFLNK
ncbi:alpha/beta hydrolase [Niabella yanshanensis]|uniref:Alpha/beta hydrolase n=1 Tax=Niabella yanshanensis TaxID=577386 RepID=A0ABZ0W7L4_9BACT|nr:alpha/beta hydrolase [Niabella yanshanensis]WQD37517.1 alpha/beta hydrolase [Niabella yanshanensis]